MTNEELKNDELEQINPADIIFNDDDDMDMPVPQTNNYDAEAQAASEDNLKLHPTELFMTLFADSLGKMPYASVLKNSAGNSIKLVDLMAFVEANKAEMTVKDMNVILSFVSVCNHDYVKTLMHLVETAQQVLWTVDR